MITYATETDSPLRRRLIKLIEHVSGQPKLDRLYQTYRQESRATDNIWAEAIERLGIRLTLKSGDCDGIPKEGPLVIVSNHPFGVLDRATFRGLCQSSHFDF